MKYLNQSILISLIYKGLHFPISRYGVIDPSVSGSSSEYLGNL